MNLSEQWTPVICGNQLKVPFSITGSFPATVALYAVDIETKALNNEGEIFGTAIINLGEKTNVETPTIKSVFNEIQQKVKNIN